MMSLQVGEIYKKLPTNYHRRCARTRLVNEINTLVRCQSLHDLPVYPVMIQLIADESRLLGTVPAIPELKPFQWPKSGMVTTTKEKFTVKD
jgi:hypothetical protein